MQYEASAGAGAPSADSALYVVTEGVYGEQGAARRSNACAAAMAWRAPVRIARRVLAWPCNLTLGRGAMHSQQAWRRCRRWCRILEATRPPPARRQASTSEVKRTSRWETMATWMSESLAGPTPGLLKLSSGSFSQLRAEQMRQTRNSRTPHALQRHVERCLCSVLLSRRERVQLID